MCGVDFFLWFSFGSVFEKLFRFVMSSVRFGSKKRSSVGILQLFTTDVKANTTVTVDFDVTHNNDK